MSYLGETIDEDEDIMIGYTHEGAGWERTYIVHGDVTPSAFRNRQRA